MKKYAAEFVHRGLLAAWGGPVALAVIYLCHAAVGVRTLSPIEVARAILTITLMAFVAGGITMIYQIERLPLFPALLLHGVVLYGDYLFIYLANGWLAEGHTPFWLFTASFVVGYALIWAFIYCTTRAKTRRINRALNR